MNRKVFSQTSDMELWMVKDSQRQIPVYVTPGKTNHDDREAWLITPACPLEHDQVEWLAYHLDAITPFKVDDGWVARPSRANLVLIKASGITPLRYLIWGDSKPPDFETLNQKRKDPKISSFDAFVDYVANQVGYGNAHEVKLVWYNCCQCAVNWMVVERKPLDLLFAQIHALPYRANWQQIMTAKFLHFGPLGRLSDEKLKAELMMTNFPQQLERPEMVSMRESGIFDWTLCVKTTDQFHQHLRQYERKQLDALGQHGYYERWLRIVRNSYESILWIFRSFFMQSSWPMGVVDTSLPEQRRFLKWLLKKGRVRPLAPDVPATDYCTDQEPDDDQPQGANRAGHSPTFSVREMPDKNLKVDLRTTRRTR
jgi:hypothetical protein